MAMIEYCILLNVKWHSCQWSQSERWGANREWTLCHKHLGIPVCGMYCTVMCTIFPFSYYVQYSIYIKQGKEMKIKLHLNVISSDPSNTFHSTPQNTLYQIYCTLAPTPPHLPPPPILSLLKTYKKTPGIKAVEYYCLLEQYQGPSYSMLFHKACQNTPLFWRIWKCSCTLCKVKDFGLTVTYICSTCKAHWVRD